MLFFITSFVGVSFTIAKRIGKNPNVLPKGDPVYAFIGWHFKLIILALLIYTILILLFPHHIFSVFKIHFLDVELLKYIGITLMIFSFVWVIIAQLQMKDSWRIGIDRKMRTELITDGLFGFSRNPIFLGMTASLIGFFLVFPTGIVFIFLLVGSLLMQIQIRLEEEHLLNEHGQKYLIYKKRVRRMLSLC
ncbi:methyltransferase family protein [Chryseobacterium sp. PMSZPI]|uniref:methyltransferase family protein n=1 Tax=Chryseobacterium sp. PMSZPI TaxID=1033900 RepID=UPI001E4C7016|nr:isoprenylcysteine carboxylmethyltransferase family protein [Chryseobacterium sp. PMSZPI]